MGNEAIYESVVKYLGSLRQGKIDPPTLEHYKHRLEPVLKSHGIPFEIVRFRAANKVLTAQRFSDNLFIIPLNKTRQRRSKREFCLLCYISPLTANAPCLQEYPPRN